MCRDGKLEHTTNLIAEQQVMIKRIHEEARSYSERTLQMENEMNALKMYYENSHSWRMTKPLRKVANALRRNK